MGNFCVRNLGGTQPSNHERDRSIVYQVNSARLDLTQLDWKDTVPFIPPVEEAYVIKVYDGDTITVAAAFYWEPLKAYRFSVRILGIDAPEKKTKNKDEKYVAEIAQKFVADKLLHKFVSLRDVSTDKYGRLLANVYSTETGKSIGKELIDNRMAVEYDGGTKKTPDNWKTYYESKK
jgi:micrococcal nuclease